jgi:hypothetical protein
MEPEIGDESRDANHAVIPDPLDPTREAERIKRAKQRLRREAAARQRGASDDVHMHVDADVGAPGEQSAHDYGAAARAELLGGGNPCGQDGGAHNHDLSTSMVFNTLAVMFRSQEVQLPHNGAASMDGVLRRGSMRARSRRSAFQTFGTESL